MTTLRDPLSSKTTVAPRDLSQRSVFLKPALPDTTATLLSCRVRQIWMRACPTVLVAAFSTTQSPGCRAQVHVLQGWLDGLFAKSRCRNVDFALDLQITQLFPIL